VDLTPGEYTQLTGRAGRRGIDEEGHAVVVAGPRLEPTAVLALASKRTYPLRSAFRPTYNMTVNLTARLGRQRAREMLGLSFAQFQADRSVAAAGRRLRDLDRAIAGYADAIARGEGATAAQRSRHRARWRRRLELAEAEREALHRSIGRRTGSLARQFDQVCGVLDALGYLNGGEVTAAGRILQRIYAERDLTIAECVREGVWTGLGPAALAAAVTALVYEPRAAEAEAPELPRGAVRQAIRAEARAWRRVAEEESLRGLEQSPGVEPAASETIRRWAQGQSLAQALSADLLSPGDFVRLASRVVDVLGHVKSVAPDSDLYHNAELAQDQLRRGVVAFDQA
jgi:ATP-dependent RNA helicase HelY